MPGDCLYKICSTSCDLNWIWIKPIIHQTNFKSIYLLGLFITFGVQSNALTPISVLVSVPFNEPWLFRKELIEPAVNFALDSLQKKADYNLDEFHFQVNYRNSNCSLKGALWVVEEYYERCGTSDRAHRCNITTPLLLLGPVCNIPTLVVATFAGYWNIPIISAGTHVTLTTEAPNYFSTLVSGITPTFSDFGFFLTKCFSKAYQKKIIHLVAENAFRGSTTENECYNLMAEIDSILLVNSFTTESHRIINSELDPKEFVASLYEPEVVLICASDKTVRKIMLSAWHAGFAIKGIHDWFVVDLFNDSSLDYGGWKQGDQYDQLAKRAFQALHIFTMKPGTSKQFSLFRREVEEEYQKNGIKEKVNAFTEGFHDAVLMFAYAINKTRSQNKSLLDGGSITDNLKNVVIQGINGPVAFNHRGQRLGSYVLLTMTDNSKGNYQPIVDYDGHTKRLKADLKALLQPEKSNDPLSNLVQLKEETHQHHKGNKYLSDIYGEGRTMGGVISTCIAIVICCLVFAARMHCRNRRCCKSSENHRSVSNAPTESHIPLQDEELAVTCVTTLEDDTKV